MSTEVVKKESFKLFDGIAGRYDFINSVLSFGMHYGWRRSLRKEILSNEQKGLSVLDLATGTGDVAITLASHPHVKSVTGIDLSEGMMAVGRVKISKLGLDKKIRLETGDACAIKRNGFDAATMAFGIRNVPDPLLCLKEIYKALKPGGKVVVLEFALPKSRVFRFLHLFYLRNVLPQIGMLLSGHQIAYRYLNQTIETFPYGEDFIKLMDEAGFSKTSYQPLSFGIVHLYRGNK